MYRALLVTMVFAAVGLMSSTSANAQSHGHHHGYSCGGKSHSSGFVQFGFGSPYRYGYYARPVIPAYGVGYVPVYGPYYGGCGGYGYPVYRGYGSGVSFGFTF